MDQKSINLVMVMIFPLIQLPAYWWMGYYYIFNNHNPKKWNEKRKKKHTQVDHPFSEQLHKICLIIYLTTIFHGTGFMTLFLTSIITISFTYILSLVFLHWFGIWKVIITCDKCFDIFEIEKQNKKRAWLQNVMKSFAGFFFWERLINHEGWLRF